VEEALGANVLSEDGKGRMEERPTTWMGTFGAHGTWRRWDLDGWTKSGGGLGH